MSQEDARRPDEQEQQAVKAPSNDLCSSAVQVPEEHAQQEESQEDEQRPDEQEQQGRGRQELREAREQEQQEQHHQQNVAMNLKDAFMALPSSAVEALWCSFFLWLLSLIYFFLDYFYFSAREDFIPRGML